MFLENVLPFLPLFINYKRDILKLSLFHAKIVCFIVTQCRPSNLMFVNLTNDKSKQSRKYTEWI